MSRFDPRLRAAVARDIVRVGAGSADDLFAPPTPSALAVGPAGIVANALHSRVWWKRGGRAGARTLDLGASHSVDGVAVVAGAIWVTSGADDHVLRLDRDSGRVAAEIPIAAVANARVASPDAITLGDGAIWVTDALADSVSRIDPSLNAVTATIKVGRRPTRIAFGEGAVWVVNAADGTVSRIDPRADVVRATIPVGRDVTGIAAGLGAVWVTVGGGPPPAVSPRAPRPMRPLASSMCAPSLQGGGSADLLVASDLPTWLGSSHAAPPFADMRAAVRLVLRRHRFRAGRYRIAYQACDDSRPGLGAYPERCGANANADAQDTSLIGVIGTSTPHAPR